MKKTGIITLHHNQNYGAVLQAYSLQKMIENLGYECQLINYVPKTEKKAFQLFDVSFSQRAFIKNIRTLFRLANLIKRKKAFAEFAKRYYHLTEFFDERNLPTETAIGLDVYITGSDQTFNLLLMGDERARYPYFLDFVHDHRKISYAASMGEKTSLLSDGHREWMKKALSDYNALLVREESAANFIEELGVKRPKVVLDPTLLLNKQMWNEIILPTRYDEEKYILFYSVLSDEWVIEKVEQIAKELNMKVVAPHLKNRYELSADFCRADEYGPGGFLSLIKNAAFVCTTSFHGTVFSFLYNKPFLSFVLGEGNRIRGLTESVGLEDRMVYKDTPIDVSTMLEINFEQANMRLEEMRKYSIRYLENALNG